MASSGTDELENCLKQLSLCEVRKEESSILEKLQDSECPFTWKIQYEKTGLPIIDRMQEKLIEMVGEDPYEAWKLFVLNMVICWEYAKMNKFHEAVEKLQQCEMILEGERNSDAPTIMGDGLKHITLASKCFLFYLDESIDNSVIDTIICKITPVDLLSKRDVSSVYCMKGAIYGEYGFDGAQESLKYIEKGISFCDNCPHWHYLLGRSLGRLRRILNRGSIPEKREFNALEKAVELAPSPIFSILLSQSYREAARSLILDKERNKMRNLKPMVDSLNKKSLDIIRKISESLDNNTPSVNIRCALGFMKLPCPWRDLPSAKSCILKALSEAPNNPMGNHVAGNYYYLVKQSKKALDHYKKAAELGVFGAEMDVLRMKIELNESYDMLPDLMKIYEKYPEKPRKLVILAYLGSYYYHVKHDFKKAFVYWSQIVDTDIHSSALKMSLQALFKTKQSIHEIILVKIFKLMKNNDLTSEERDKYAHIIDKYIDDLPDVIEEVRKRHFGVTFKGTSTADVGDLVPHASDSSKSQRLVSCSGTGIRTSDNTSKDHGSSRASHGTDVNSPDMVPHRGKCDKIVNEDVVEYREQGAIPRSHKNGNSNHRGSNDAFRGKHNVPTSEDNASRGRYNAAIDSNSDKYNARSGHNFRSRGRGGRSRGGRGKSRNANDVSKSASDVLKGSDNQFRGSHRVPRGRCKMPLRTDKIPSSSNVTPGVSKETPKNGKETLTTVTTRPGAEI